MSEARRSDTVVAPGAAQRYLGALRAESGKIARRPALLAILGCLPGFVGLRYWMGYSRFIQLRAEVIELPVELEALLAALLPAYSVRQVVEDLPLFGVAGAVVIGVLTAGVEHASDTWKLSLTQGPRRLEVFAAKASALAVALAVALAASLAVAAGASALIAVVEGEPIVFPIVSYAARGVGSGLLMLFVWGFVGFMLATLVRSTGLAMGVALLHMFAVEGSAATAAQVSATAGGVAEWLIWGNTATLLGALVHMEVGGIDIPPWRAALTLCAYAAAALAVSALVLRRRDVT